MKVTKIIVERVYHLGNYESLRLGLEAEVEESENLLEAYSNIEKLLDEQASEYKNSLKSK